MYHYLLLILLFSIPKYVSPYCEIINNLIGLIALRQEIQILLSTMKSGALQEGTEDYGLAAQVI